jgi:hypothetical protein
MALQLIYTSAPRLLQAGRTGFGTVAAHPGIPSWLVGEIERASQFSRVPGLDSARVVVRHMVFGQGDRVHHVLSRIQDAGADYTGRTNHIAHHFVFTAAEAAKATALGVTPVDVLAFLESHKLWQTAWDGEPRLLGDDTLLPVESIPKTITLPAETSHWGALVPGRPECAAILAPGKTSEACWIVYPQGWRDAIVYAMGESLALHSNPWGVSFANDLQPTDNEQQIAWRGIPADSPLLQKAQSSVRPCIDLTNPSALAFQPVPEFVEEARTGKKPQPKSRPAPLAAKSRQKSEETPAPAIALLSKSNERPRRNPYALPLVVIMGILVLALGVGGGIWGYDLYSKDKAMNEKIAGLKSEISQHLHGRNDVPDLSSFKNLDELETLFEFLKEISKEDIARSEESLGKLREFSQEWTRWREFCNDLLDEKKEASKAKNLNDLYAKASQGDVLTDEQRNQFQTLTKTLYPEDEKWENAVKAVIFLKNPDADQFIAWMKKREMPETTNGLNLNDQVLKKIHQIKIDEYNQNIADISEENQFRDSLTKHLNDWPQGSEQRKFLEEYLGPEVVTNSSQTMISISEKFENLKLEPPKSLESKLHEDSESKKLGRGDYLSEVALPPIYIVNKNQSKLFFIPTGKQKWRLLKSDKLLWGDFNSSFDVWDNEEGATHFPKSEIESKQFVVYKKDEESRAILEWFVINFDTLLNPNNDFKKIVDISNNDLTLKKDFLIFLNRLYKNKGTRYPIAWSLKYESILFKNYNLNKKEINFGLGEIKIALGDYIASIHSEEKLIQSEFYKKKADLDKLTNDLFQKSDKFKEKFPLNQKKFANWEEFAKAIKEKIAKAEKEKLEVKTFKEVFLNNGAKKIDDFLSKYADLKQKDQFLKSLSRMDAEVKKWFFFEKDNWSEESQKSFKEQFDHESFKKLHGDIANLERQISGLKDNKSLEERRSQLSAVKSSIKANLNFYLEEADTDPFLTTEVTIPYLPERSADSNTPSLPPTP